MEMRDLLTQLNSNLEHLLKRHCPHHPIAEAYHYAVLPAGKLFRPQLVFAVAQDFGKLDARTLDHHSDHGLYASAIEIHHAYTLVHDDLPCMDNDDFRRGKPSTHKAYGEWQALLVGDGLLSLSYRLQSCMRSPHLPEVLNFFSWATGAKGLIHGQVLDLSEEMKLSFKTLLETHKLKTARLIQASLCGSYLLLPDQQLKTFTKLFRLGHALGIAFQLLDDLTELAEAELSPHEASIAPWINYPQEAQKELILRLTQVHQFFESHHSPVLKKVLQDYFAKIQGMVKVGEKNIEKHLAKCATPAKLAPIMALLDRIC